MDMILYTKSSLQEFIMSDHFRELENIPISFRRAFSQIHNPRLEEEDVLLAVYFDGNKTAGYLGAMPDLIFREGKKEKVYWLTCYWVDPVYKPHKLAAKLYKRVLEELKGDAFVTNLVPWSERLYERMGAFLPVMVKMGHRGYMRLNLAEILPPKKPIFKSLLPLLKMGDTLFNLFADLRFCLNKGEERFPFVYTYCSRFDESMQPFIEKVSGADWIKKGVKELNWILDYPWVIGGATKDADSERYYFSSLSKRFFHQLVKINAPDGELKALILLTVRDNKLTIPYVFSEDASI